MEPNGSAEHIRSLHELVVGSSDIHAILNGVTGFASDAMSKVAGENIDCALTLRRRKRTATVAGSSARAVHLDKIEQALGQGPCLEALDAGHPVLLADVATDTSWPEYSRALAAEGIHSALGVPMDLGETSQAVINFFAPNAGTFTQAVIDEAAAFTEVTGSTLRLAIRIETVEQLNADLKTAMSSRTVIDLACGVIMAQSRCTQDEAFEFLTKASSHRNQKLHAVASDIIAHLSGSTENHLRFED
ncbi:GAF and ANTAR domain-containing protein [Arthrobacter sp. YN]|uniref:GAF and ANTAR domain-containing protein n=1 Tax=Arthrobacter sp. YN TaxID=2020486 RepID=UPI000B604054|nr:GAF and ANTAR domain-containing protein [Arthrobacter sp. YN]ASN18610.1 histidine kinase [Arthrobacter sp. YN]